MDELFGLPAHPLVVHAPVVLLPLAAIGVLATLIRPSWYHRYRWPTLAIGLVGALGAIVAAGSGEELEERVEGSAGSAARQAIHDHAESGELARTVAIVFALALLAYVALPWFLARRAEVDEESSGPAGPGWLRPVLMVAVAVTAVASVGTIVAAGHSGAESVWDEVQVVGDD